MNTAIHILAGIGLLSILALVTWLLLARKLQEARASNSLDAAHDAALKAEHAEPVKYVAHVIGIEQESAKLFAALARCDIADAKAHAAALKEAVDHL